MRAWGRVAQKASELSALAAKLSTLDEALMRKSPSAENRYFH
jgi:hypothetical protein